MHAGGGAHVVHHSTQYPSSVAITVVPARAATSAHR